MLSYIRVILHAAAVYAIFGKSNLEGENINNDPIHPNYHSHWVYGLNLSSVNSKQT
jgi:hypothetical protein